MLLALPVALAAWLVYSQAAFGTWNPLEEPARITYCGMTYVAPPAGPYWTRSQIETDGVPLQRVGFTASGAGIYAKPLPDSVRSQYPGGASWPCATGGVYLRIGTDEYRWYPPSGIALGL